MILQTKSDPATRIICKREKILRVTRQGTADELALFLQSDHFPDQWVDIHPIVSIFSATTYLFIVDCSLAGIYLPQCTAERI